MLSNVSQVYKNTSQSVGKSFISETEKIEGQKQASHAELQKETTRNRTMSMYSTHSSK
jgi:3-methyladenine DNA glycosylase Mpg